MALSYLPTLINVGKNFLTYIFHFFFGFKWNVCQCYKNIAHLLWGNIHGIAQSNAVNMLYLKILFQHRNERGK